MLLALLSGTLAGFILWRFFHRLRLTTAAIRKSLASCIQQLRQLPQLATDRERERALQQIGLSLIAISLQGMAITLFFAMLAGWPLLISVFSLTDWLVQTSAMLASAFTCHYFWRHRLEN